MKVIGAGLAFRSVGSEGAGYTLLDAFSGDDEQEKMLAGISLVKAGERSVDLIEKARQDGPAHTGGRAPARRHRRSPLPRPSHRDLRRSRPGGRLPPTESLQVLDQIEAMEDD